MVARVSTELHRPLREVPLLQDVLGRYRARHVREVALYRSGLAMVLADANGLEQAAEGARSVIGASGDLSSERTEDVPEVLTDYGRLWLV